MPMRRILTNIFLGAVLIFLLYRIAFRSSTTPLDLAGKSPSKGKAGQLPWSRRKPDYPVIELTQLPTDPVRKLPRIQHESVPETADQKNIRLIRQAAVKKTFKKCWQSYKKYAWMTDELAPISARARNTFGGWAATLVDSLDTLWIMDMKPEFDEAVRASTKIDYAVSSGETTNVFETNIRYLGGFLAAYDFSGKKELLDSAVEVGEMILAAFDTPNHMPITRWKWQNARDGYKQAAPDWMLLSELGSFSLEFTRLSQITGDMRWYDAVARITRILEEQQMKTRLPGMWPVMIDPRNEVLTKDASFTLGGMSDSTYEYLPKQHMLLGGIKPEYEVMYQRAMDAAIDRLFFRPMTPTDEDILISGDIRGFYQDGQTQLILQPRGQHLGCFTGGMLAVGGRLFSNDTHFNIGKKLTDGCIWAYKTMDRGIMAEIATFVPCDSKDHCPWDEAKWHSAIKNRSGASGETRSIAEVISQGNLPKGIVSFDAREYILRPEAIESVFIMYRVSGDRKYLDDAWDMFTAIVEATETEFGNAAVKDITTPKAVGQTAKQDRMESFWMAESLKYFYLIFSEPDLISLDEYVLNTEAHPLRRPA